jgi:ribosomal subunit interface protein
MATSVQITFRDMPHSDSVMAHVEKRAAKLETFSDHITRCHVVLEMPHRHKTHGHRYHVRIDAHIPGRELVVSRTSPHGAEDLNALVDEAFADAERLLAEEKPKARAERRSATARLRT